MKNPTIFRINDYEWWIAESLEEAIHAAKTIGDCPNEGIDCPRPVTESEMDRLIFHDDEASEKPDMESWVCECGAKADAMCRWNGSAFEHHHGYPVGHVVMKNIHRRTFREELKRRVEAGLNGPEIFASTES